MASKQFTAFSGTPKPILLLLCAGILLRFAQQFLLPTYNGDEVALGLNIRFRDFSGLLYPLTDEQSSPPLFLLLQKCMTYLPIPVWIGLKSLSFISSVASLLLFARLLRRLDWWIAAIPLIIFAFNPFIVANSLTLKQYTFDLLGILLLVNFYDRDRFKKLLPLFFLIWCLISNVGLFGCAGYLLYRFVEQRNFTKPANWIPFAKKHLLILLAPIPYLVYFFWFMQQDGAYELKIYMQEFWKSSFIPLNLGFFKYIAYFVHSVWIYILNAYEAIGFLMLSVCGYGLYRWITKKQLDYQPELTLLFAVLLINVVLNILQLYPLSDRLYLYTVPLYLLLFGATLNELIKNLRRKKAIASALMLLLIGSYASYTYNKDEDLPTLYATLDHLGTKKQFYATKRVIRGHDRFNQFTQNYFLGDRSLTLLKIEQNLDQADYLISRVHSKFGPFNKTAAEEVQVVELLKQSKIALLQKTEGYNIYKIKH